MLKVGLTGGIGSGKSLVAKFFHELGIQIIEADDIAREVTAPEQPAYQKIVEKFGTKILTNEKQIDRSQLRKLIFNHFAEKRWLENLLHPLIKKDILDKSSACSSLYCIVVIPLLVETNSYDLVDRVLLVDSPIERQIERVILRDETNEEAVLAIIHSQASREERLAIADEIILNNKSPIHLKNKVYELHLKYTQLSSRY
jgi:dephospho-CoA kinase